VTANTAIEQQMVVTGWNLVVNLKARQADDNETKWIILNTSFCSRLKLQFFKDTKVS